MDEEDIVMRYLTLAIPVTLIIGSVFCLIATIRGKSFSGKYAVHPKLTGNERKREIIIGCIVSLGMLIFGGWLLYCWLFGPIER